MFATLELREQMAKLLAADTATLAPAALANHVTLLKAPIAPGEGVTIADLTFADFDGSTPIDVTVGAQAEGLDPATSDAIITMSPPVGGFRWETTGVTNLPQTIYGYAMLNSTDGKLWATEALATPITLTASNQVIDLGNVNLREIAGCLQ